MSKLFRTKSINQLISEPDEAGHTLKRALKAPDLIALGIGAIIGAGIFASTGSAAAGTAHNPGAGPAIVLSYILVAIACGFCALCYAEFASLIPIAGSAYTYAYATLGELVAWIIGWDLILEYAVGNVAVAISWSGYFDSMVRGLARLFHSTFAIPKWLLTPTMDQSVTPEIIAGAPQIAGHAFYFNLPALLIVLAMTALLIRGVKESAHFNNFVVVVKLVVILFFIAMGFKFVDPSNWHPFAPNGWHGIQAGATVIFFAYIGFDAVSTAAEETEDPGKNLPIGMIGSLIICTILYILVSAVLTGMVPWNELGSADPMATAFEKLAQHPGRSAFDLQLLQACQLIVAIGAVFSMTAVLLVFQMGQPRIFFSIARDGLLPPFFAAIHPVYQTPWVTTIFTGLAVGISACFLDISVVLELCNIGTLFAFVIVCASILLLRYRDGVKSEIRDAPYRVCAILTILLGAVMCAGAALLASSMSTEFVLCLVCGPVCLVIGYKFLTTAGCTPRPFNTPFVPLFPMLGIISCFYLMLGSTMTTWLRFVIWLVVGMFIYTLYGIRHSRLNKGTDV